MIAALGRKLKEAFGITAAVGRVNGCQFMVVRQIREKSEVQGLRSLVKRTAESLREIDGVPITLYLSLGYALFSESKDLDMLTQSAEMRLLVDHDEHVPVEERQSASSDFFRLYDDLPISYAVYRVHTNSQRKVTDAELFYANRLFERRGDRPLSEMLGHSVRELFPGLDERWFELAGRAALRGETVVETLHYEKTGQRYYMTVSQIIRPGFCSITYQELDEKGVPLAPTGN